MNIEELLKLKEEVKTLTSEERKERVVKIENKLDLANNHEKSETEEKFVILEEGLWDLDDVHVALNNVKTKDEIYSMVDTEGALKDIEALVEKNTIELWNQSYTDQDFTMSDPGIVVTKEFYEKASDKLREVKKETKSTSSDELHNIKITKDDCLDDIICIHYNCAVKDAESDYDTKSFSKMTTRLVRFNEFCKGIRDLGYDFYEYDDSDSITFDDYLEEVNKGDGFFDFSVEDPNYYKSNNSNQR